MYYSGFYRDDGLNFSDSCNNDIELLLNALNNINPDIQFTYDVYCGGLVCHYLDLTIYLTIYGFITEVFSKDTDDHMYLFPGSQHAFYVWDGIIIGTALRIRSLCHDMFLEDNVRKYKSYLLQRDFYDTGTIIE